MKEWSNLPNAKHIDWVIQSLKDNTEEWNKAWDDARAWNSAYYPAWDAVWGTTYHAAWHAAYDAARNAARDAAWNAARDAALVKEWDVEYYPARDAMLALVAYDDSAKYLSLDFAELKCIVDSTRHPAAVLLLPAVKARELINNKAAPAVKAPLDGKTVEIDGIKYRLTPV